MAAVFASVAVRKRLTKQLSVGLPFKITMMFIVPGAWLASITSPEDSPCEHPAVAITFMAMPFFCFVTIDMFAILAAVIIATKSVVSSRFFWAA